MGVICNSHNRRHLWCEYYATNNYSPSAEFLIKPINVKCFIINSQNYNNMIDSSGSSI